MANVAAGPSDSSPPTGFLPPLNELSAKGLGIDGVINGSDSFDVMGNLWLFVLTFTLLLIFDFVLCKPFVVNNMARWFFLHAFGNFIVILSTCGCLYHTIADPLAVVSEKRLYRFDASTVTAMLIHLYHVLFFKCTTADWFHHLSFVGGGCIIQWLWGNYLGYLTGVYHFFVTGLPGGLDYFVLGCVEQRWLTKQSRISFAVEMNTWLRSPGLALSWAMVFIRCKQYSLLCCAACGFLGIFNGQFYMQQVLLAAGSKYGQRRGLVEKAS